MTIQGPQQERSRVTRRRLVAAAVECLGEFGWNRTTVSVIARRAGVSRGAAQHHFPTREDLVVAAVEHVGQEQVAELRNRAAGLAPGPGRAEPIAEMLLDLYTGPMFRAALHLWVEAASDESLREVLAPLEARVGREAHKMVLDLLGADESQPGARETIQATLDLARGLGLANLLTDDTRRRRQIARQWARTLEPLVSPGE